MCCGIVLRLVRNAVTHKDIVRRSIAIPKTLVDDLIQTAPPELKSNLNRLVIAAIQGFIKLQERQMFDEAMTRMSKDPAAQAEIKAIQAEFCPADFDGLSAGESAIGRDRPASGRSLIVSDDSINSKPLVVVVGSSGD